MNHFFKIATCTRTCTRPRYCAKRIIMSSLTWPAVADQHAPGAPVVENKELEGACAGACLYFQEIWSVFTSEVSSHGRGTARSPSRRCCYDIVASNCKSCVRRGLAPTAAHMRRSCGQAIVATSSLQTPMRFANKPLQN